MEFDTTDADKDMHGTVSANTNEEYVDRLDIPVIKIDLLGYQTNDIKKRLNTLRSRRLKLLNEDEEEQCIEKIRQLKSFLMESPKGILWYDDRIFTEIIEKVLVVSKDEIEFELKCGFRFKERIVWN